MLPADQLAEVIASKNKADLFVDGVVDRSNDTITLTRGDLTTIIVSLSTFSMDGACKPDFNSFELDDYGYTLRFGEYEASAHSVLYRADPTYRRRIDRQRINQRSPLIMAWCATFAAVLFAGLAAAIHHEHHGTYDPEELLAGLASLAIVTGFVSAIIGLVRGLRVRAGRKVFYLAFPLLLNGGVIVLFLVKALTTTVVLH